LYDYSLKTFYKENSRVEKYDMNIWYVTKYTSKYQVKLHVPEYLSVYFEQYVCFEGAMHGIPHDYGVVFDRETGEKVTSASYYKGNDLSKIDPKSKIVLKKE
jgi:hypothetical protein